MSVYKDSKRGTWYFITRVKQADGSYKQIKRRGFEGKKEAQIAEAEALLAEPKQKEITFGDVAEQYMTWYEARRKTSSTNKVGSLVKNHLVTRYGDRPIADITAGDIMDHQTELINQYAGSHVSMIHAVLSSIFKYAIKKQYIKENPARIAGGPDVEKNKMVNYWTLEEFKEFIRHVDDPMYYTLFMTLYYSGMRKGELLALRWGDIDFENNTININKTEYKRVIQTPKTTSSIRKILMPKHVMRLLSKLKDNQKPKMIYSVFGEFTTSISETTLTRRFHKYLKVSGVKKIRLHDFRHSHASYLINKGTIVSVVAARLGHGDIATTLNTYSHLYPTKEKEAVLDMENDFKTAQVIKMLP